MCGDNLILLSPSISELQTMVRICCCELEAINLTLNVKKSKCLRIGKNCFSKCCDIMANNITIAWTTEVKYLGITIIRGKKFRVSFEEAKAKFYSAFNALYSKLGCILDINVIIHLMEYITVPILCYAIDCLELSKTELSSLNFTLKRALFKIFKVSNTECLDHLLRI